MPLSPHFNALDTRDTTSIGQNLALQRVACLLNELVRQIEDEDAGVLDRVFERGVGDDVLWQATWAGT